MRTGRGSNRVTVKSELAEGVKRRRGQERTGGKQSREGTERIVASGYSVCVLKEGGHGWLQGGCAHSTKSLQGLKQSKAHHYPGKERAGLDRVFCFYQHHHPCMGKEQDHLTCHSFGMRSREKYRKIKWK